MRTLLITLQVLEQHYDLRVPGEVPVGDLVPTLLATYYNRPRDGSMFDPTRWRIGVSGSRAPIPVAQSLLDAGVLNGAVLVLRDLAAWQQNEDSGATMALSPGRERETGGHGSTFHIPARDYPPRLPDGEIVIAAPPALQQQKQGVAAWMQFLLPILGCMGGSVFILTYFFGNTGSNRTIMLIVAIAMPVITIGTSLTSNIVQRVMQKQQRQYARDAFMEYMTNWRTRLRDIAEKQRQVSQRLYPELVALVNAVQQRTYLWERRPEDHDFLHVAVGRGPAPLSQPIRLDLKSDPMVKYEPELRMRAEALIAEYHHLEDEPAVVPLRNIGTLTISGDHTTSRALARYILCQIVAFHSPKDVRCLAFFPPHTAQEWGWLKWLPHVQRLRHVKPDKRQLAEPLCLLADSPEDCYAVLVSQVKPELELRRKLSEDKRESGARVLLPHLVLVIDGYTLRGPLAQMPELDELFHDAAKLGVTVLCLVSEQSQEPSETQARINIIGNDWLSFEEAAYDGRRMKGIIPCVADATSCEQIARSMAPLTLAGEGAEEDLAQDVRLLDLLGIASAESVQTTMTWQPHERERILRVPIGRREKGRDLIIDLKEAAEKGDGPHGLVIGATGSGKSELLRTLVISQAIAHDPYTVNFVFVDFKGGASFADLASLPHVAGMITNLENEPSLVDRMYASLQGELKRRQTMLREAGNLDNVQQYQAKWRGNQSMVPMPHLLVIVDEFAELLTNRSDFLDLFITIGRVGRSLGIHLLLATQRLEEGRLKGLESYLRYRICLRTFSAAESNTVLGRPDAYYLPSAPGVGYIKIDANVPERFKTALISAPYVPATRQVTPADLMREFTAAGQLIPCRNQRDIPGTGRTESTDRSEMDVVIARLASAVTERNQYRVHQVWLPPLEKNIALGALVRPVLLNGSGGLEQIWQKMPPFGMLTVPIGLTDVPLDQAQRPLLLDFSGSGGHLALVGAPQSGKSTLIRTLITSFILTHSPRDVQLYCIDLGGGQLRAFEAAPHIGAVCTKGEREKVRLLIRLMYKVIADREMLFREHNIESMATYRQRRQAGELADAHFGDVFLIIDNMAQFQNDFDQLEGDIVSLVTTGLTYGVHIIIATNRWAEIRSKVRDNIGTRLELRLNEPTESEVDRRKAAELPIGIPGRGLTKDKLQFQTCLPALQDATVERSGQGLDALLRRAQAWRGPVASPVIMLPAQVREAEVTRPSIGEPAGVMIGLEEFRLEPVYVDLFTMGPHFIVLGDAECGKTNLLRLWMHGLAQRCTPAEVQIAAIECRTTVNFLDINKSPHCLAYASMRMPASVKDAVDRLTRVLKERALPTNFTSIEDLAQAQSWSGPHYFLFVDDYEAVASPTNSPLAPLRDYILQARDIGFHLVLTRSVGGMSSSAFESIIKSLREMGSPGLIMSGERQEGKLLHDQLAQPFPAGRGTLVRRKHPPVQVQVALAETAALIPQIR